MSNPEFKRVEILLRPDQFLWLRAIALKRTLEVGGIADASFVVRSILDHYKDQEEAQRAEKSTKRKKGFDIALPNQTNDGRIPDVIKKRRSNQSR